MNADSHTSPRVRLAFLKNKETGCRPTRHGCAGGAFRASWVLRQCSACSGTFWIVNPVAGSPGGVCFACLSEKFFSGTLCDHYDRVALLLHLIVTIITSSIIVVTNRYDCNQQTILAPTVGITTTTDQPRLRLKNGRLTAHPLHDMRQTALGALKHNVRFWHKAEVHVSGSEGSCTSRRRRGGENTKCTRSLLSAIHCVL